MGLNLYLVLDFDVIVEVAPLVIEGRNGHLHGGAGGGFLGFLG